MSKNQDLHFLNSQLSAMRIYLFCLVLLPLAATAQLSSNMSMIGNFDLAGLPVRFDSEYNDVWGYRAANGTEVAILGGIEDIFFIDISIPSQPELIYTHSVLNMNGTQNASLWRDFKTYSHYAYAAADEGDSGLLIFDLSNVPESVTLVTQTNAFWSRSHNIFIDELHGRLYGAGTNTQSNGLKILDLTDPENPTQLAAVALTSLGGGYVHDVHVRDNIAYCSHGSLHKLQMYDFSNLPSFSLAGVVENYPEAGYNHSSWLNAEGDYLVMCDETHGSDVKLVNVSEPFDISADDVSTFYSELLGPDAPGSSVAHNPFILGDLAFIAYYHDGVQVFDISNPDNIELVGFYDTHDSNGYSGYDGCWGVYPYLASGLILASDQNNGLFVLELEDETLDIDFVSFQAGKSDGKVNLQWTVIDGSFGNTFEVKRSDDNGTTYATIGTVSFNSFQNQYTFTDYNISASQKHLYRIDFVQLDGKRIPSPVRSIITDRDKTALKVATLSSGTIQVDILQPMESLTLQVYDLEGKLLWSDADVQVKARIDLELESLATGQYVLAAKWPGGNENVFFQVFR